MYRRASDVGSIMGGGSTMKIYPLGYAQPQAAQVMDTLMETPSTLLIDTRYSPSSMRTEWRKHALEQKYGTRYRWAGQYLGNTNYQHGGDIELADPAAGIRGLRTYLAKGHDLILLCACKEYEQCHRRTIVNLLLQEEPTVEVVQPEQPIATLPTFKALSIRQPYAAMLAHPEWFEMAHVPAKRIENRDWSTHHRGPLLLHAGKQFDHNALPYWLGRFPTLAEALPLSQDGYERGGIIGIADVVDVVTSSTDPWFCGKYGFVLANARPLPFTACAGQLSLFSVSLDQDI
jgi:hypothetical protein